MNFRKGRRLLSMLSMVALLSGCALLPEEEEYRSIPVVREYTAQEYQYATVTRGDLALTESISCQYLPAKEVERSFGVGGVYYENIYVERGDSVQEGQLLAELQLGDLADEELELKQQVELLQLEIEQFQAQRALSTKQAELQTRNMTSEDRAQALRQNEETLNDQEQSLRDQLYIARMKLEEVGEEIGRRRIYADFDGTVTYLRTVKDGELSVENQIILKISDLSTSVFMGESLNAGLYSVGDEVTLTSGDNTYYARVASPEELGLERTVDEQTGEISVYFVLTQPAPELERGDKASTELVVEKRENVLYVDEDCVVETSQGYAVYVPDPETGLRTLAPVEIGLSADKKIEITAGLNEGDRLIKG